MACACLCFPPTANVMSIGGPRSISDLKPGHVLETVRLDKRGKAAGLKATQFYTYAHFNPNQVAEFLTLKCDNGAELTLTGSHLLFKRRQNGSYKAIPAAEILIGDTLGYLNNSKELLQVRVVEIRKVTYQGVYAPLTKNGTLIVDGFLVSCYAEVKSHAKAHAFLAPLRFVHGSMSDILRKSKLELSMNKNGVNRYVQFLLNIGAMLPKYAKV